MRVRGRGRDSAYDIARRVDQRLRRTDVAPVGRLAIADHHGTVAKQPRKRLALQGHHLTGGDRVDDAAPEDVAAGVDLVGDRIRRLLEERQHPIVSIGRHTAEGGRVRHLDQMQGQLGIGRVDMLQLSGDVVAGQLVAVEHDHPIVGGAQQRGRGVAQPTAGAERLGLGHVVECEPERTAVAEHRLEVGRMVGGRQHDVLDADGSELGQLVLQKRHATDREQMLGPPVGQGSQPGAETARQDHRLHHAQDRTWSPLRWPPWLSW